MESNVRNKEGFEREPFAEEKTSLECLNTKKKQLNAGVGCLGSWLDEQLAKFGFKGKKRRQFKLLLLILLLGVLLMLFGNCEQNPQATDELREETETVLSEEAFSTYDEEKQLEQKLINVLEKIKGVGNVSVSVTLASGSRTEYAVNASTTVHTTEENGADGSEKNTTETTTDHDIVFQEEQNNPVIVQESRAEVQGVLIVADGGDDQRVVGQITAAVSALLDLPVHKVIVCDTEDTLS